MTDVGNEEAGMRDCTDADTPSFKTTVSCAADGTLGVRLQVGSRAARLTCEQARFFARKLAYMARLVEERRVARMRVELEG